MARSAWIPPLKKIPKALPPRLPPMAKPLPYGKPIPLKTETVIPHYDPSRIFKDIKVVKDLRQNGAARGETQTGDRGMLGPGGVGFESRYKTPEAPAEKGALGLTPLQMGLLGVAGFLLLGG